MTLLSPSSSLYVTSEDRDFDLYRIIKEQPQQCSLWNVKVMKTFGKASKEQCTNRLNANYYVPNKSTELWTNLKTVYGTSRLCTKRIWSKEKGQRTKKNNESIRTISTKRKIELFKIVWDGDNLVEEIRESKSGMEPTWSVGNSNSHVSLSL